MVFQCVEGLSMFFQDVFMGVLGFQGLFMDFTGLKAVSGFFSRGSCVFIVFFHVLSPVQDV